VAVERDFRRLAIVLSCFLLFIGVAFDMIVVVPHTTVRLTLIDGRQETITVQWVGDYPTDRESLARELSERRGVAVQASEIKNVTILRGPKAIRRIRTGTVPTLKPSGLQAGDHEDERPVQSHLPDPRQYGLDCGDGEARDDCSENDGENPAPPGLAPPRGRIHRFFADLA